MHLFDSLNFFDVGSYWLLLDWAIRIGAIFVVPQNRKPSSGTAWLLLIFLLPTFGLLAYIVLGSPKLPKSRRTAQKTLDGIIAKTIKNTQRSHDLDTLLDATPPVKYAQIAALSEALGHMPVFGGNLATILPDYNDVFERIVRDIDTAEHYVHLEYFIVVLDEITAPIFDALARAHNRGVVTRVLYDSFSTRRYKDWKKTIAKLETDGAIVQAMLPFKLPGKGYVRPDLRNHRKLVVIDGHTGYTGSQNLVQRDYHRKDDIYYKELVVRIQGPVAMQLAAVFLSDWYSETGTLLDYRNLGSTPANLQSYGDSLAQILPSGPGFDDENNLKLFTSLIHAAQKHITITNPYFVPDDALTIAITSAAKRGVSVTMINSEAMDQWMVGYAQRSFYDVLLKAGVHIYWYDKPVLVHSKFITVDDEIATIGSSNLDIRSFSLNLEVTLVSYDPMVVKKLRKIESDYLAGATQVTAAHWKKRTRKQRLLDNIARLTSALQ